MPIINCHVCGGSGTCPQCRGARAAIIPYHGLVGCSICHAEGACPECRGQRYFEISQEEWDRREVAHRAAEEARVLREQEEIEAARKEILSGRCRIEAASWGISDFIHKARRSGLPSFNIKEKGARLVEICEALQRADLAIDEDTKKRLREARLVMAEERRKAEEASRQRAAEEAERAQEEAARQKAAETKQAFWQGVRRGAAFLSLGSLAGGLYFLATPSGKEFLYRPTRKAVNSVFKGTKYSVAHLPGYSIVLRLNPQDTKKLAKAHALIANKKFPKFELTKDAYFYWKAPEGGYAVKTDATNVVAIIVDRTLLDKDDVRSFGEGFGRIWGSKERLSITTFDSSVRAKESPYQEALGKISDNVHSGNSFNGITYHGNKLVHVTPAKVTIYLPKNNKFDLINGQAPDSQGTSLGL